jgi:hypothetical protein
MTEDEKKVREYLAEIGKRGGPSEPARANEIACTTNGGHPRDETPGDKTGQTLAATQSQIAEPDLRTAFRSLS